MVGGNFPLLLCVLKLFRLVSSSMGGRLSWGKWGEMKSILSPYVRRLKNVEVVCGRSLVSFD